MCVQRTRVNSLTAPLKRSFVASFLYDSEAEIIERYKQYRERDGGSVQISGVREEGVDMSPVDLVRNYVHEHFEGETAQRDAYERLWLPIERTCCEAAARAGLQVYPWAACERVFALALAQLAGSRVHAGVEIYGAFIKWWEPDSCQPENSAPAACVASSGAGGDPETRMSRFGDAVAAVVATAFEGEL